MSLANEVFVIGSILNRTETRHFGVDVSAVRARVVATKSAPYRIDKRLVLVEASLNELRILAPVFRIANDPGDILAEAGTVVRRSPVFLVPDTELSEYRTRSLLMST